LPVKAFSIEFKSLTDKGQFSGLASTDGNVDQGGDVCMPGCFSRTLQDGKSRPLLWQHEQPVGLVTLTDSPEGLVCDGQLSMGVQAAKDAFTLVKDGVVRGLSIGFQTVKESFAGEVRQLDELRLFEVSLTPFPMNLAATVSGVKAVQQRAAEERIRAALKSFRTDILGALQGKT
jgi:HK97 family phage prohead protease